MILSKRGGDERCDHAPAALAGMGERVAQEVHAAALPGGAEHAGDRRLDALVRVRDHQLDPGQAATLELAQELDPEGLGLRGADRHAEDLAPAVSIDRDRDGHRDRDDAPGLAHLDVGRVDPEIGRLPWSERVGAPLPNPTGQSLDRPLEEGLDALVDLTAQAADLALRDAGHAERPDQLVDRARRDALHVGFLDDCRECLLGRPPRLQETREVSCPS
jgi:hypothetical protein